MNCCLYGNRTSSSNIKCEGEHFLTEFLFLFFLNTQYILYTYNTVNSQYY